MTFLLLPCAVVFHNLQPSNVWEQINEANMQKISGKFHYGPISTKLFLQQSSKMSGLVMTVEDLKGGGCKFSIQGSRQSGKLELTFFGSEIMGSQVVAAILSTKKTGSLALPPILSHPPILWQFWAIRNWFSCSSSYSSPSPHTKITSSSNFTQKHPQKSQMCCPWLLISQRSKDFKMPRRQKIGSLLRLIYGNGWWRVCGGQMASIDLTPGGDYIAAHHRTKGQGNRPLLSSCR